MKDLIAKFEARGLELDIDLENLCAKCLRPSKRALLGYKVEFNYRFGSEKNMIAFMEHYISDLELIEERKAERKAKRGAERKAAQESVKEGDIYVASWGWEQTNVDAYQVVAKKGASVVLRKIAVRSIEGSEQFMSDRVVPVKNAFIGEDFKKRIAGKYINIDNIRCALPAEEGKEFYRSWYA
jgi:hypothetical protein